MKKLCAGLMVFALLFTNASFANDDSVTQVEKAAVQGNAAAQYNLGVMYFDGKGVKQDHGKAREWFEKAAAQGDADAQYNLGFMYSNGKGVRQDYVKAKEWYGRACDSGDQRGCDAYRGLNK